MENEYLSVLKVSVAFPVQLSGSRPIVYCKIKLEFSVCTSTNGVARSKEPSTKITKLLASIKKKNKRNDQRQNKCKGKKKEGIRMNE